jgi:serine/threonine protein kinase
LIAGRYRLIARLGSGSMGVVWQAYDEALHRIVAIKQLVLPAGLSDTERDEVTSLAMREGRITARLQHPHVIAVHEMVQHYRHPCLIMEYLPSRSLATVLSTHGELVPEAVASIGHQISSALAAAHEAGVVHRDIKPGNVLLADDGTAKITDFGVSHAVGDFTVTTLGILVGTPAYLAPEVAQGNRAGFASDVFSLGSTLYTALEGIPPFGINDDTVALLDRVASGEIVPPRRCGALTPLLLHLLQRDPQDRPTMRQAQAVLAMLDEGLVRSHGGLSACTLPLSGLDPPVQPLPSLPRSSVAPVAPKQTSSTAGSAPVDASAGQPPAEDDDLVWSGAHLLLVGAITVAVLTAGVLVTFFMGRGSVLSSHAAALAHTSGVSAPMMLQALPVQPDLSDPTPGTPPPTPVIPDDPQDIPEQSSQTQAPMPEDPPVARNRLTADSQRNYAGDVTKHRIQKRQSFREPDRSWDLHRGWSGKNRNSYY